MENDEDKKFLNRPSPSSAESQRFFFRSDSGVDQESLVGPRFGEGDEPDVDVVHTDEQMWVWHH